ncbi:MAG: N-6 DNA methylase [Candidatus Cloacimonetes bacterium]|jgi:type I restriction enzyme M protein|nr:N-6 DNA methylase [Candidatus Cloacimonadota bacterium]
MKNIGNIIKTIQNIMRKDPGVSGDAQRIEQLGWMISLKVLDDKDKELKLINGKYKSPIPENLKWRNWAGDDEGMTGDELQEFVDNELIPQLCSLDISSGNKHSIIVREIFEGTNNYMKNGTVIRQVINELNKIDFNSYEDRHLFGDIYESILKDLQSAGQYGEFYTPRAITKFITEMVDPHLGEKILDPACGTGGFLTAAIEHIREKEVKSTGHLKSLQNNIHGMELKPLPFMLSVTNLILHDIEVPNIDYVDSLNREYTSIQQRDRVDVILANPPFGASVTDGVETNFPRNYRTTESADLFLVLMIRYLKKGGRAGIVLPDGSLTGDGVKERIRKHLLEECNLHTIVRLPNSVFKPYAGVATNLLFFEKGKSTKEIWYWEHKLPEDYKAYSKTKPIKLTEFKSLKKWWDNRKTNEQAWKVSIKEIQKNGHNLDINNPHIQEDEIQYSKEEILEILHNSLRKSDEILNKLKDDLVG